MGKLVNIVGKRFGKLKVIGVSPDRTKGGDIKYICKCDCGNYTEVIGYNLRAGNSTSCGCGRVKDLTGKRFGRLTVLGPTNKRYYGYVIWKCQCDCGNIVYEPMHNISYNKNVKSCGCMLNENQNSWGEKISKHNKYIKNKKSYNVSDENGNKFLVDLEDKDKIKSYYWKKPKHCNIFVAHDKVAYKKGVKTTVPLWRVILNDKNKKHQIEFVNGNKSDYRKANLKVVKK